MKAWLHTLRLSEPFRIAHGVSDERLVVRVQHGESLAEAPLVPYYHEDPAAALSALSQLASPEDELPDTAPRAAQLALDVLRHDLAARAAGQPLWQQLGLSWPKGEPVFEQGCRSLSIPTDLVAFAAKVAATAKQFPVLKLKLGSGDLAHDLAIVRTACHAAPEAKIFADVNGGWSVADTVIMLPQLAELGMVFVEQPFSHGLGIAAWQQFRQLLPQAPLPIIADESLQGLSDLDALRPYADGINVKLLKARSLSTAIALMRQARAHGLLVLLGCMIESSLGVTPAAHLACLADWIDLDGHLYLANDDYAGLSYDERGRMRV